MVALKKEIVKKVVKTKTVTKRPTKKVSAKKVVVKKVATKRTVRKKPDVIFKRHESNPIINPNPSAYWESEAVFNPAAVVSGGRIHLFYRALGPEGISRVGYASSDDGIHFDKRLTYPVYASSNMIEVNGPFPYTSPARRKYDTGLYASGGGWGGCEDPRAVKIDNRIYLTYNVFNGWHSIHIDLTSIAESDLNAGRFYWRRAINLSQPNERHKNWVLFPEKVNGKYVLLHNLYDEDPARVQIKYLDTLELSGPLPSFNSPDPHLLPDREIAWHNRTRSVGPPPIKTESGWLVFYHAMDPQDPNRYKLGAMLLDLEDPTKVIYRSRYPVLEPDEWYENDWKAGIIYVSGAVVKDGTLFLYYGGGDKHVAVAHANLQNFIQKLMKNEHAVFSTEKTSLK